MQWRRTLFVSVVGYFKLEFSAGCFFKNELFQWPMIVVEVPFMSLIKVL
jgi:hypothetical protein